MTEDGGDNRRRGEAAGGEDLNGARAACNAL